MKSLRSLAEDQDSLQGPGWSLQECMGGAGRHRHELQTPRTTETGCVRNKSEPVCTPTCLSIALNANDRSLVVRISPAFPNVKPWLRGEEKKEKKKKGYCPFLIISILTPVGIFTSIFTLLTYSSTIQITEVYDQTLTQSPNFKFLYYPITSMQKES